VEKKGDIAEAGDERAGRWPENVVAALAGVIRTCLGPREERYDSMTVPMGILVGLEQKHCGKSQPEEWGRMVTCCVCSEDKAESVGIRCKSANVNAGQEPHFFCPSPCFDDMVREQCGQDRRGSFLANGATIRCRCCVVDAPAASSDDCAVSFTEKDTVTHTCDATYATYQAIMEDAWHEIIHQKVEAVMVDVDSVVQYYQDLVTKRIVDLDSPEIIRCPNPKELGRRRRNRRAKSRKGWL
jgi:hypothetical protein